MVTLLEWVRSDAPAARNVGGQRRRMGAQPECRPGARGRITASVAGVPRSFAVLRNGNFFQGRILGAAIRARVAWARGDAAETLRALEGTRIERYPGDFVPHAQYWVHGYERDPIGDRA